MAMIEEARRARGLSVRAAAKRAGLPASTLSDHENGKTRLSAERERRAIHALALGSRSPIEEEHDSEPNFLVLGIIRGGPAIVLPDDADRIPVFASARRAELTAAGLRELGIFDHGVVVAPAWGSGVSELLMRNRFPGGLDHLDDQEAAAAVEQAVAGVYLVEAVADSAEEADRLARELPEQMMEGERRRLAREWGMTREQIQAVADEFAAQEDARR